jgi:hypothetical protein
MCQVILTGTVMSPTEIYDTAEDRKMQRFEALVGKGLAHHGVGRRLI